MLIDRVSTEAFGIRNIFKIEGTITQHNNLSSPTSFYDNSSCQSLGFTFRVRESQAHIDYENGRYLPAIFLLKQLLKIYPKDTGLMTDLASAEGDLSNYTGALSLYKKTLSIDSFILPSREA